MVQSWLGRQAKDPEGQVLLAWPVPTEVVGQGLIVVPDGARVVDARAEGQILDFPVRVGEPVQRGDVLFRIFLPVLDQTLRRQERDLRELVRINDDLDRRDAIRLAAARRVRDTALAKLQAEDGRLAALHRIYDQKLADFRLLSRREVVAPLALEVVSTEDRATQIAVAIDNLRIREREVVDAYEKVKLEIDTEQQRRRYRIDDTRRAIKVTRARIAYDGTLLADRDGRLLDLQVVRGQTVKPGQRLGTLGSHTGDTATPGTAKPADTCLLYTSPSPRDLSTSRMPSSA